MGNNAKQPHSRGPCATCDANGGTWYGEPGSVHCLRPEDSGRHVMRGPEPGCLWWRPLGPPVPPPKRIVGWREEG